MGYFVVLNVNEDCKTECNDTTHTGPNAKICPKDALKVGNS